MEETQEAIAAPSAFFEAHFETLARAAASAPLLDLACGRGRHALVAARRGLAVRAVDRNREALEAVSKLEIPAPGSVEVVLLDLEVEDSPPVGRDEYGAIVVSRYLHRPLMPWIEGALIPGGVLLYETFLVAQRELGWGPRRADFLLEPGELPGLVPSLEVVVYEEGPSDDMPAAQTARLLARRTD